MSSQILCIGDEWFPNKPGGLSRYTYELTHQLAISPDQIYLAGFVLLLEECQKLWNRSIPAL
jgi:hypothetical protein